MQAVVNFHGKQYKVQKDQVLYIDLNGQEAGQELNSEEVLLITNGSDTKIGSPFVSGASVTAKILEEVKGKKVRGFKYTPRKSSTRRRWGHRQRYLKVEIASIKG